LFLEQLLGAELSCSKRNSCRGAGNFHCHYKEDQPQISSEPVQSN